MSKRKPHTQAEWEYIVYVLASMLNEHIQHVDRLKAVLTATAEKQPQEVARLMPAWLKRHTGMKKVTVETLMPFVDDVMEKPKPLPGLPTGRKVN